MTHIAGKVELDPPSTIGARGFRDLPLLQIEQLILLAKLRKILWSE